MKIESAPNYKNLTVNEFYRFVDRKKFSIISPKVVPIHVVDPMHFEHSGFDICIFQLLEGGRYGSTSTAVYLRSTSIDLPKFLLKPASFGNPFALFRNKGINLPNLSSSYFLIGDDEGRIRSLFQPQVLRFFKMQESMVVESIGRAIIIYQLNNQCDLVFEKEKGMKYIERALNVLELFNSGEIKPQITESFTDTDEKPEDKARSITSLAQINLLANIVNISLLYLNLGGILAHIISSFLVMESIGLFLYARWSKKENPADAVTCAADFIVEPRGDTYGMDSK